ncbi:hypothetical protein [Hymenobacter cellulosilyticus]
MLHLKDPRGKEPELFQNISQLKARVLDIAVRQVSEHTDLKIDYELVKKGRAYDAVRFTIARQQPQQLPIPFEQPAEDAARTRPASTWRPSVSISRSWWPPSSATQALGPTLQIHVPVEDRQGKGDQKSGRAVFEDLRATLSFYLGRYAVANCRRRGKQGKGSGFVPLSAQLPVRPRNVRSPYNAQ